MDQQRFAELVFQHDRSNGMYPTEKRFDELMPEERSAYLDEAATFLILPQSTWPPYVLANLKG